jgi:hypothetical protein
MALRSTQPLVKMRTRDVPGGKGGRCVRQTTYHHIAPMSRNLGALTFLDTSGPAWPVMGVLYLYFYLTRKDKKRNKYQEGLIHLCKNLPFLSF